MIINISEDTARTIGLILAHIVPITTPENQNAIQLFMDALTQPQRSNGRDDDAQALLARKRAYVDQLRHALIKDGQRAPTITGTSVAAEQIDEYIETLKERCFNSDVTFPTF